MRCRELRWEETAGYFEEKNNYEIPAFDRVATAGGVTERERGEKKRKIKTTKGAKEREKRKDAGAVLR